ncbi:MAG: hypothetical protein GDA55_01185 [Cellvibrionales bacterium]|nr:hypothetical protein [Cellvibrionales bacterium]
MSEPNPTTPTVHKVATKVDVLEERMNTQYAKQRAIIATHQRDTQTVLQTVLDRMADLKTEITKRESDHQAEQAKRDIEQAKRTAEQAKRDADHRADIERLGKEVLQHQITRDRWVLGLLFSLLGASLIGTLLLLARLYLFDPFPFQTTQFPNQPPHQTTQIETSATN